MVQNAFIARLFSGCSDFVTKKRIARLRITISLYFAPFRFIFLSNDVELRELRNTLYGPGLPAESAGLFAFRRI